MCDRYFIELPPMEPLTPESLLEESLALVHPKDIQLHKMVFLLPFEPQTEKAEKRRMWSRNQRRRDDDPGVVLRRNIKFMINKTKHFGLLLSQLTWVGLMNFAEKRRVLQQSDDSLRAAALYIIMLKKEESGLTQFINCLHMTGNHEIANIIEAKLELLELNCVNCEHYDTDGFDTSVQMNQRFLPPKKRKTSADSGFDDTDDEEEFESSIAVGRVHGGVRKYICNIRPLDAVDVIAIINGKEDSRYKVELCKCGNYHQFPKWKEVSTDQAAKENNKTCKHTSSSSGLGKYFSRSKSETLEPIRQGILSPVAQPVEVGSDLSHGVSENIGFTKPRRSCSHLKLRFSATESFAKHPDTEDAQGECDSASFKDKLPRFLRQFL